MNYQLNDNIAILTFDDGKANVVGNAFIDNINTGLNRQLVQLQQAQYAANKLLIRAKTLQAMQDDLDAFKIR